MKINQLINIISEARLQFFIFENIIIFKLRKRSEIMIINFIFITINIVNIIIKCDIIKKLNFDLNYETLFTKLNRNIQFIFFKKIRN